MGRTTVKPSGLHVGCVISGVVLFKINKILTIVKPVVVVVVVVVVVCAAAVVVHLYAGYL
jgi:hypothetical protein